MKVKDMLIMLRREQSEVRHRYHELEAHQKTLVIELARVGNDIEKAEKIMNRLAGGIQSILDAQVDG